MWYNLSEAPQRYGRWCESHFVGRLETDSSKGTFYVSGVGLPSALSCKDPELNIKKTITGLFFFVFRVRKFGVIFR